MNVRQIVLLAGAVVLLAGCGERPPVETVQTGYRGTGMEQYYNPRLLQQVAAANQPPALVPAADSSGPRAGEVYQNVQVLKDLSVGEFTRVMLAITAWVAPPDQSCAYCHVAGEALSADTLYTKVVARRMLEMTRYVNTSWKPHVGETGVTCYTCHKGKPVPAYTWFRDAGPAENGVISTRAQQNAPATSVGLASLPYDPFTPFLLGDASIRVQGTTALPTGNRGSVKQAEWTYGLMMHMSTSLGVNCTYCHNSHSWSDWTNSTPQRAKAWHGIRLARDLNVQFLVPLTDQFPAHRRGAQGDVAKVNCQTCHAGVYKPLFGVSIAKDYPELQSARPMPEPSAPAPAGDAGGGTDAEATAAPAPDAPVAAIAAAITVPGIH